MTLRYSLNNGKDWNDIIFGKDFRYKGFKFGHKRMKSHNLIIKKKTNKDAMAAQHYNSCPFMAMEPTKLKYFKIWTTKKKGKSPASCSLHPYHLKKMETVQCRPLTLLPYWQMSDHFPSGICSCYSPPPYRHYYKKFHTLPISHSMSSSPSLFTLLIQPLII